MMSMRLILTQTKMVTICPFQVVMGTFQAEILRAN